MRLQESYERASVAVAKTNKTGKAIKTRIRSREEIDRAEILADSAAGATARREPGPRVEYKVFARSLGLL
jgi:hypothetical protein